MSLRTLVAPQVRSQVADDLVRYLEDIAADAAALPPYYPHHLRSAGSGATGFDQIRQIVQVVEDRTRWEEWLNRLREKSRAAGSDISDVAYAPRGSAPEKERASHQRLSAPPTTIRWDQNAGRRFRRAVILGDPAIGKTWLLRYEARRLARDALEALSNAALNTDDLEVPILIRLPDLNQHDSAIEEALVDVACAGYSNAFRRWLRQRIEDGLCRILLDAWDEVPVEVPAPGQPVAYVRGYRQRLGQRLQALVKQFTKARLLATSRTVGYGFPPFPSATELELLAFEPVQTEVFVTAWFGSHHAAKALELLTLLRQNPPIRGLARIPLMLALICRAYQENVLHAASRRCLLYHLSLRGLLRDWQSEKQRREISPAYVDGLLEMLQTICYDLSLDGLEQFSESALRMKMLPWLEKVSPAHELNGRSPTSLIVELKSSGILVPAGNIRNELTLLHRTFHEYLTSAALSRLHNWFDVVLARLYDPEWQEVLRLVAGSLGNRVKAYISQLLKENARDALCRPLEIAVTAAAESEPGVLPQVLLDGLARQVVDCYCRSPVHLPRRHFLQLLGIIGWCAMPAVVRRLQEEHQNSQYPQQTLRQVLRDGPAFDLALATLGWPGALSNLLNRLRHSDQNDHVLIAAVTLLATTETILGLTAWLSEPSVNVRTNAIKVLARAAIADSVPSLLICLSNDPDPIIRAFAAEALGAIGFYDALPELLRCSCDDPEWLVRSVAIDSVSRIAGHESAASVMRSFEHDPDHRVRSAAAEVLGTLGSFEATPALIRGLRRVVKAGYNGSKLEGNAIASALSRIANPQAVPDLLELLDEGVLWAAEILSDMRAADAVPRMLEILRRLRRYSSYSQADLVMFETIFEALGHIGDARIVDDLLSLGSRDSHGDLSFEYGWGGGVTLAANNALAKLGVPEARQALISILEQRSQGGDPPKLRAAAATAAAELGIVEAVPALLGALWDVGYYEEWSYSPRISEARALGHLGTPTAVAPLFRFLSSHCAGVSGLPLGQLDNYQYRTAYFQGSQYSEHFGRSPSEGEEDQGAVAVAFSALASIAHRHRIPITVVQSAEYSVVSWYRSLNQVLSDLASYIQDPGCATEPSKDDVVLNAAPSALEDDIQRRVSDEEVARLAYSYGQARGGHGGSPEEDWVRAERELLSGPTT